MNGTFFLHFLHINPGAEGASAGFEEFMRQKDMLQLEAFVRAGFNMNCSNTLNYQAERIEILLNYIQLLLEKLVLQIFALN